MTGRLILIGMPAGGKTTIGAALARALSAVRGLRPLSGA